MSPPPSTTSTCAVMKLPARGQQHRRARHVVRLSQPTQGIGARDACRALRIGPQGFRKVSADDPARTGDQGNFAGPVEKVHG